MSDPADLPRPDLLAVIVRIPAAWNRPYPLYELDVRGRRVRCGDLQGARQVAEAEMGEPLRWEQVSADRHEAWSHRQL